MKEFEKTILIVDDTISNLDILGELLEQYDLIDATSGEDALEIVQEEKVDLILLDIMMPDMDGYEVCQKLKANEKTKDIPVIFITAVTDEDGIEQAYDVGGSDYITKPFKPKELLARVKTQLKVQQLINDLEVTKKDLEHLASTDSLTQIYNRRYFSIIASEVLYLAVREKKELAVLMIDIDNFKSINDTYGHDIGDDVIVAFSNIIKENKRMSDVPCRYGGEEFVLLLPATDDLGAKRVAELIREKAANSLIELENNQSLEFTVSIGVSSVDIEKEKAVELALNRADKALYRAKKAGRNQVTVG